MHAVIAQSVLTPHIGLNAHLLSLQQTYRGAGISWYIYNLLGHLAANQDAHPLRYTVFLNDHTFSAPPPLRLRYGAFPTHHPLARILWEQLIQPWILRRTGIDLLHALAFVAPVATPCPFVTTIYDLSFMRYPEAFKPWNRFYLQTFTRKSAERAQAIITISESTRQDVIRFFGVRPEKVQTVHCGVDTGFQELSPAEVEAFRQRQGLPEKFIMYLGTLEPRKNVAGLIRAYAAWQKADQAAPKLFVCGGKGWYYQEVFELVNQLNLAGSVIFPGYVPQEDLRFWYNAATMLVYPSFFEGFGLPVLEAMACGTPVITSNLSSLPEVAGDAAQLINPNDHEALTQAMQQIFNDAELRQSMREKGLLQKTKFSWQETARKTNAIYAQILADMR